MKKLLVLVLSLVMIFTMSTVAFANQTLTESPATTPVKLNIDEGGIATIKFEIPEAYSITTAGGYNVEDNNVSPQYSLKNLADAGAIKITNIKVQGQNGWEAVAGDKNAFKNYPLGSKKLAMGLGQLGNPDFAGMGGDFSQDFSADKSIEVLPGQTYQSMFWALIPPQAEAMTAVTIANVVTTVSF